MSPEPRDGVPLHFVFNDENALDDPLLAPGEFALKRLPRRFDGTPNDCMDTCSIRVFFLQSGPQMVCDLELSSSLQNVRNKDRSDLNINAYASNYFIPLNYSQTKLTIACKNESRVSLWWILFSKYIFLIFITYFDSFIVMILCIINSMQNPKCGRIDHEAHSICTHEIFCNIPPQPHDYE